MWLIYIIGVAIALAAAWIMRSTLFKGDGEVYLMELPPYRMPTAKSLLLHMWDRGKMYVQKAGTIILAASIILYICNSFPERQVFSVDYDSQIAAAAKLPGDAAGKTVRKLENAKQAEMMEYTVSGRIGKMLEPLVKPIGFDWKLATASIGALAAKEVFVSQLGILYHEGEVDEKSEAMRQHLRKNYTPLQGFCVMLFCLLSIPCLGTLAVIKRELNSWKMVFVEAGGLLLLAYTLTFIVYQGGKLLNIGTQLLG